MRVAIVGNWDDEKLAEVMEQMIVKSQCYLFTVVCNSAESAGYRWAEKVGLPVEAFKGADVDKLVRMIDFVVALSDGNETVKKIIMKMNMCGKHGIVWRI